MRFLSNTPQGWGWGAIVALTLTLLLQTGLWFSQPRNRGGGWIHAQIAKLPDDEVEPWLRGFAQSRGASALPLVVRDLGAERPAVRDAALSILQAEVGKWRTIPQEQAAQRGAVIATELRGLRRLSPEAEAVAGLVYAWVVSEDCPSADRSRLLVALHGLPRRRPLPAVVDEPRPVEAAQTPSPPPMGRAVSEEVAAAPVFRQTSTAPTAPPRAIVQLPAPEIRPARPAPQLLAPDLSETAAPIDNDDEEDWNLSPRPLTVEANEGIAVPAPPEPNINPGATQHATTRELIGLLHASGRAPAEQELRRRGFEEEQLELARHLSSPDATERRKWTEALPRVSEIDSCAWLVWMTDDVDAAVRRAAVTLLATMRDVTATARLREIAARDPDPGIRRLAGEHAAQE